MKRLLLPFLLSLCSLTLFAQNITIKGKVTDETGAPMPGVTVSLKNGKAGVQADKDGNYSISVPAAGKIELVFSYAGYQSVTLSTDGRSVLNVKMEKSAAALDDVVVIGYQAVRKKDLTSSVSSISAKDLKDNPSNSTAEALAGRLAGVFVNVSEGAPGADVEVNVRGRGSITQNGSPLYIVDGVQVENALTVLAPQDIASIDVLKDAASTAIYGARGSNGVFLITTKSGRNLGGRTVITYNGFAGVNKLSRKLDMLDPYEFVLAAYERARYTENQVDTPVVNQYIRTLSNFDTIANYKNYPGAIDWQDKMLGRTAFQMTHNLSIMGGTNTTTYNIGLTYNKQEGLLINSDYNRILGNFKLDHKVNDKLKVGISGRYNVQKITGAGTSDASGAGTNRLRQYVRYRPLVLPGQTDDYYDPDLDARNPGNGLNELNPLLVANAEYRLRRITAYTFSGYFNYNITKRLSLRSTIGYNVSETESRSFDDTLTALSRANARLPVLTWNFVRLSSVTNSNVLTYSNPAILKSKHAVDVLVGHEIYTTNAKLSSQQYMYFPVGTKPDVAFANLGLATPPVGLAQPKPSSSEERTRLLSFFSRVSYKYDDKYYLTLNLRTDGSSIFGPDYSSPIPPSDPKNRKWGWFPSASVAWAVSNESFMKKVDFISLAKLRLSYGSSGNNRLNPYGYTTGYSPPANAGYGLNDVLNYTLTLPQRLGNPIITWEELTSQNVGVDLGFFNDRLLLTADFYSNVTKNLLVENKIPSSSGYTTQYQNLGKVENRGIELQLSANVMRTKAFNWTSSFNIAFNSNKIKSLGKQTKFTANSGWFSSTNNPDDYLLKVGESIGAIYGLVNDGYYTVNDFTAERYYDANYPGLTWRYKLKSGLPDPGGLLGDLVAPGQMKFRDMNGDGKLSLDSDRVVIGNALPKFNGGFNQQFSYKGFDLSIFINFSYGASIFNANKLEFSNAYGADVNMMAIMKDRWRFIDPRGNLVQKQLNATTVIGISPDSLSAVNANARIWTPSRSTNGFAPMSFAVEDGSYIRINNITLGYNFPASMLKKFHVSSFRIYATVYNVATITGYSGYDPDVNAKRNSPMTPGVDYSAYPRGRSYIAGVNLSF